MPITFLIDLYNPMFEKEMKKYVNYFLTLKTKKKKISNF